MDWAPQTLVWWNTWRSAPQSQTFTDTDWSFLLDTAVLHTLFWSGAIAAAAELRLRVAKFGATPEDRARLRLEINPPNGVPVASSPAAKKRAAAKRASHDPRVRLRVVDEPAS